MTKYTTSYEVWFIYFFLVIVRILDIYNYTYKRSLGIWSLVQLEVNTRNEFNVIYNIKYNNTILNTLYIL